MGIRSAITITVVGLLVLICIFLSTFLPSRFAHAGKNQLDATNPTVSVAKRIHQFGEKITFPFSNAHSSGDKCWNPGECTWIALLPDRGNNSMRNQLHAYHIYIPLGGSAKAVDKAVDKYVYEFIINAQNEHNNLRLHLADIKMDGVRALACMKIL